MPDMPDKIHNDCIDLRAHLSAYIDDELDDERRHSLDRHLVGCETCRALVDETERLADLVQRDVASELSELPEGFAGTVLARTVFEEDRSERSYRFSVWTSAIGWVAAAAALGLAAIGWYQQQASPPAPTPPPSVAQTNYRPYYRTNARSFVADAAPANAPAPVETHLAVEDRDTVHAASLLVAALADADVESFADVESVRRIAMYDDILPRLRETRAHVDPMDRAAVLATESLLHRVVNGPIDQADLQELRETAESSSLAAELMRIGGANGWSV